jgi:hypothetical protein
MNLPINPGSSHPISDLDRNRQATAVTGLARCFCLKSPKECIREAE